MKKLNHKAVIYARVSTSSQDYNQQINELSTYAKLHNFQVIKVYKEKITGSSKGKDRPEFSKMLIELQKGEISNILCWELSRLGRSIVDVLNNIEIFSGLGINVFVFNGALNTLNMDGTKNASAGLYISLLSGFAEFERDMTRERVIRGVKNSKITGSPNGGAIVYYGYEKINKEIVIEEEEAKIVRDIFELYLFGMGTNRIADHLNKEKIPTKYNKTFDKPIRLKGGGERSSYAFIWTAGTIWHILKNPIYRGLRRTKSYPEYENNPNFIDRDDSVYKHLDFKKWDYIVVRELQIVDTSTWNKAQEILCSKFNKTKTESSYVNLLKGKVKCGSCGQSYFMHKRADNKDNAYKCISRRGGSYKADCNNYGANIDKVNFIIRHIISLCGEFKINDRVPELLDQLIGISDAKQRIEDKLTRIQRREKKLYKDFSNDFMEERVYLELKDEFKQNAHKVEEELDHITSEEQKINVLISLHEGGYFKQSKVDNIPWDAESLKAIFDKYIESVEVNETDKDLSKIFSSQCDVIIKLFVRLRDQRVYEAYFSRLTKLAVVNGKLIDIDTKAINIVIS